MKYIFSLILALSCAHGHSGQLKIYFVKGQKKEANFVKEVFTQKHNIPEILVETKPQKSCKSRDPRFVELCLNKKGELVLLSSKNISKKIKSLKVFSPKGANNEI